MQHLLQDTDWIDPFTVDPSKMNTISPPRTANPRVLQLQPMTACSTMSDESPRYPGPTPFVVNVPGMQRASGLGYGQQMMHAPRIDQRPDDLWSANPMHLMSQGTKEDSPTPFAFNVPPETSFADQPPTWNPWISNAVQPSSLVQQQHPYPDYPSAPPSAVQSHEAYPYPQYGNPQKVLPYTTYHQHMMQQSPHQGRTDTATSMSSQTSSEVVAPHHKLPTSFPIYTNPPPTALHRSFAFQPPGSYAPQTSAESQQRWQQSMVGYPVTPPQAQTAHSDVLLEVNGSYMNGFPQSPDDRQMTSSGSRPGDGLAVVKEGSPLIRKGRKRGEAKTGPNFLTKLYDVLSNPAYHHMLHWSADGLQIVIRKPKEMEAQVLPHVYKQSKFASFSRQLNIYGFMRKVSMRQGDTTRDSDVSVWTHYELDKFSIPERLMSYKRRVGPRNYNRKNVGGKPKLPVLGDGARYEYISDAMSSSPPSKNVLPTPQLVSPPAQHHSFVPPSSSTATSDPHPNAQPVSHARPIRHGNKGHRMSAGTLPMPSPRPRGSSIMHHISPRSVPYGSLVARHVPLDGVTGRGEPNILPAGQVPGGLWQQLLGNAAQQGTTKPTSPPTLSTEATTQGALPDPGFQLHPGPYAPSTFSTIPSRAIPDIRYAAAYPSRQQIMYTAGTHYQAFPYPSASASHQRALSSTSEASSTMPLTPRKLPHHGYEREDTLQIGFDSMDIHSLASSRHTESPFLPRNGKALSFTVTGSGKNTFTSYLHDISTSPGPAAEMQAEIRAVEGKRVCAGSVETLRQGGGDGMVVVIADADADADAEGEGEGNPSPPETVRPGKVGDVARS